MAQGLPTGVVGAGQSCDARLEPGEMPAVGITVHRERQRWGGEGPCGAHEGRAMALASGR